MCKLLAIVDIENEDNALEFSEFAVKPMTLVDDDGLGVVLLGDQGLGVERWLKPGDFPKAYAIDPLLSKWKALLPSGYNTEGETTQTNLYAIGVHSRKATSPKCLENVHPFVRDGLALIHNGVINNHSKFAKEVSSCDSEALLSLYITNDVKNNLSEIQKVCDEASGWYAFMVFNPEDKSLTICKDDSTSLHFAHVAGVGIVFSTTSEVIKSCCGRLKLRQPEIYTFPGEAAIRWTKDKPEIETYKIESKPTWYGQGWEDTEKSIVDISKHRHSHEKHVTKWCAHGIVTGSWCRDCKDEKDAPKVG